MCEKHVLFLRAGAYQFAHDQLSEFTTPGFQMPQERKYGKRKLPLVDLEKGEGETNVEIGSFVFSKISNCTHFTISIVTPSAPSNIYPFSCFSHYLVLLSDFHHLFAKLLINIHANTPKRKGKRSFPEPPPSGSLHPGVYPES